MARNTAAGSPHDVVRASRALRATRAAEDQAASWRFTRAVARVRAVDAILADYATSYCGRPVRRREVAPMQSAVELPGVTWSISGEVMVEFLPGESGPGRLIVSEIALLRPLKKQLRSRHFTIEYRPPAFGQPAGNQLPCSPLGTRRGMRTCATGGSGNAAASKINKDVRSASSSVANAR